MDMTHKIYWKILAILLIYCLYHVWLRSISYNFLLNWEHSWNVNRHGWCKKNIYCALKVLFLNSFILFHFYNVYAMLFIWYLFHSKSNKYSSFRVLCFYLLSFIDDFRPYAANSYDIYKKIYNCTLSNNFI